MSEPAATQIPILTEIIAERIGALQSPSELETLIAELQTRLAASTFELTERLLKSALAEMEAALYAQVSAQLRQQLPELIDRVLREQFSEQGPDET